MKIYIVTDGCYSDYHIEAVFTDKEKAKLFAALHNCSNLEEYETSDDNLKGVTTSYYTHIIRAYPKENGEFNFSYIDGGAYSTKHLREIREDGDHLKIIISLNERNDRKAFRIATDMLAEWKEKRIEQRKKNSKLIVYEE